MNPTPNNIKNPAALQKTAIKNITAITGFTETITNTLENIVAQANISINKFLMFFIFRSLRCSQRSLKKFLTLKGSNQLIIFSIYNLIVGFT